MPSIQYLETLYIIIRNRYQAGAKFRSYFVSRVSIPVPMVLYIDCHFLFEVQLLCLSLHIEVLSFEDSEWSHGRQKMECQDKLEHFRNIFLKFRTNHSFLFLMLAFLVTSNKTGQERSMLFTSQSKTSNQRCTYVHPLIFVVLAQRILVPMHPIFEPCPLNANVVRWWDGHSSSHLPVLKYTVVDNCGLMCLNDLHQTPNIFLTVECH